MKCAYALPGSYRPRRKCLRLVCRAAGSMRGNETAVTVSLPPCKKRPPAHNRDTGRGVLRLDQRRHEFTGDRPEGCVLLLINISFFTLMHSYFGYGNRGQTPLAFVALLPFVLTLPLLLTLQKFVAFVMDAPRSQKLLAANHIRTQPVSPFLDYFRPLYRALSDFFNPSRSLISSSRSPDHSSNVFSL